MRRRNEDIGDISGLQTAGHCLAPALRPRLPQVRAGRGPLISLFRKIVLTVALCSLVSGAFAAQVTIVGRWRVLSGQSSRGGAYCTMQLGKVDTFVGIQVMAKGDSLLSVGSSDWSFEPKQRVPVKVVIDGAPTWDGEAVAVLPNTLVMSLPSHAKPASALAGGKSLVATVAKQAPMTFDLAGALAARDALETCVSAAKAP